MTSVPTPEGACRVESGPLKFGADWPGLFLRGDDAIRLALAVRDVAAHARRDPDAAALLCFDLAIIDGFLEDVLEGVVVKGEGG